MRSKKLAEACLTSMFGRVEGGGRAQAGQERLKLGRVDEAMEIAFELEPLLREPTT